MKKEIIKVSLRMKADKLFEVFDYPENRVIPALRTLKGLISNAKKWSTAGDIIQEFINKAKPETIEHLLYLWMLIGKVLK